MCTAINKNGYFGRTLDLETDYGEGIVAVPRNFRFNFKHEKCDGGLAFFGIGITAEGFPLMFDAVNEKGLGAAGLNFPGEARYFSPAEGKTNLAPYELIPYILSTSETLPKALDKLMNINIINTPINDKYPVNDMHWIFSDGDNSIVAEPTENGLMVYENPVGVLTNTPAFPHHLFNLNNYLSLTPEAPHNSFSEKIDLTPYSKGMGGIGLPGDYSSMSRFVKAAFVSLNHPDSPEAVFSALSSVTVPKGSVVTRDGKSFFTRYTSVYDTQRGILYYKKGFSDFSGIRLSEELMCGSSVSEIPMENKPVVK